MNKSNSLKPILYIFLSTVILSLTKVIVKYLGVVPTPQLLFIRGIFILLMIYPLLIKNKIPIFTKYSPLLLLRGVFGTLGMFFLFYVIQHTALATSTALFYLTPIFTVIIASLILKEKMPLASWPALMICFLGIIFIKRFSFDLSLKEFIFAILSAFFAACAYNMIRVLKGKAHPLLVVFYLPIVTVPAISYWALRDWLSLNSFQWLLAILLSFLALMAQVFLTLAYQNTEAYKISHINYLGLPLGILWGYLFFSETPSHFALLGIFLVFLGLILNQIVSLRQKSQEKAKV